MVEVLGVGSILGQYIGSSKDRREARAGVLSALVDTESSRWVGPDSKTLDEFHSSMRKLQTAALIARLPRDAVEQYAVLGQAGRRSSQTVWERNADPETGGGIEEHFGRSGAGGRTSDRGYRVVPRAGPNLALAARKEAGRGTPQQLHLKGDNEHREAVA